MESVGSLFAYAVPRFDALDFPTFRRFFVSAHDHFIPHARNNHHPHVLSHRVLALFSLLLMTVKVGSIGLVALGPAVPALSSAITTNNISKLANDARLENGLNTLTYNVVLERAAQSKANDMLAKQYFSHNTPEGNTPWSFIKAAGYTYITAGENLAIDFSEAENVQTAWMNSPGHRANILNKNFEQIGIGIASGTFEGHQTTIVVQMFGTPAEQQVTMQSQPTPVVNAAPVVPPVVPASPVVQQHRTVATAPPSTEAPTPTEPEALKIVHIETALQGNALVLSVEANEPVVKLYAVYGQRGIMLDPVSENLWVGSIPLTNLNPNSQVVVKAVDTAGNTQSQEVATFAKSMQETFQPASGSVEGVTISAFGRTFDPRAFEQKFYLIAIAALLSCMVLAIGIKRHVQHVSLVANSSFVAMLAAVLLVT